MEPRGSVTVNVAPWPGSLSTVTVPPCCVTISLTRANPIPLPSYRPCGASFHLGEAVEDPLQLVTGNTDSVVFDFKFHTISLAAQPDPDLAIVGITEFERIGEQVVENLLHLAGVDFDRNRFGSCL